jgi:SAM-dependent methyltransferase
MEGPTAPVLKEYAGILAGAVGATPKTEEPEPETDLHEQHVQTLLDAPLHEPPVEPLADEVASSLLNQLPEMLIEELVRRLGPTLAGHVSEYLALPTVKPAAPAEAEPTRFSTNGHAEPATPPAELTLHVSPPAPFWPDSPDNQMEFFEPRQWEPTPRVYSAYLAEANQHGMDVNDWLHQYLGWGDCGYLIHHTLRPWLTESSRVCELGAGSGRWARHVVPRLPHGGLHLVETTPWLVEFLRRYFHGQEQVHSHLVEGYTLPFLDSWFDLVYAFETLPASSLGKIDVFAREFARVLRPGGRCVLFYLDTSGPLTWDFLRNQGTPPAAAAESFAYHAPDSIDRVLQSAGLTVERRRHLCEVYPNHPLTSVVAVRQNLPVS